MADEVGEATKDQKWCYTASEAQPNERRGGRTFGAERRAAGRMGHCSLSNYARASIGAAARFRLTGARIADS